MLVVIRQYQNKELATLAAIDLFDKYRGDPVALEDSKLIILET